MATLLAAGPAMAQPANGTCASAEVVPATTIPWQSKSIDVTSTLAASAPALTCQALSDRKIWFQFTPTTGGAYYFSTCGTNLGLTDTVIGVFSGTCGALTEFACDDDSCTTPGFASVLTTTLNAGQTYYIAVAAYGSGTGTTRLNVSQNNDVCTNAAPLATNRPVYGSQILATNHHQLDGGNVQSDGGAVFVGIGQVVGVGAFRDVVYSFTAPNAGSYSFRYTPITTTGNALLYMSNSCSSSPALLPEVLWAANRNTTLSEELSCVPLSLNQTVYVYVDELASSTSQGDFELEVTPCQSAAENGNTFSVAEALSCGVEGSLSAADVDYYTLGAPPAVAGSRVFALVDGAAAGNNDFDLRVTNDVGLPLEYDQGDNVTRFGASSPNVGGTPLVGTAAYLRINHRTAVASEPYTVFSVVQPPVTSAIAESSEPNNLPANAAGGASNYFSGVLSGSADTDIFGFRANAGDLIYLGLDGDPTRPTTNSPFSPILELLDENGETILLVNDFNATSAPANAVQAETDTAPNSPAEGLIYRARYDGVYYALVRTTAAAGGDYLLSISRNCTTGGGYTAPGSVTAVAPQVGSSNGGTRIRVTGTGFQPGAQVRVGGASATNVVFVNSTTIDATTPAGTAGNVTVEVVHPGNQAVSLLNGFQYIAPPTITSITPSSGATAGGTAFTIVGADFVGTPVTVLIGGVPPASFTVNSATQITGTTAAQGPGPVDITITTPFGTTTAVGAYTYLAPNPPPVATGMTPNTGPTNGGTVVVITGTGFRAGVTVLFGTVSAANVTLDSATQLTVVTPPAAAGLVTVTVTNTDAQSTSVPNGFTYFAPPTLSGINPTQGPAVGNTLVTLTGTAFRSGATVQFVVGGVAQPATGVTVVSATRITARTPAHTPGLADVVVANSDGQSATLSNGFRFVAAPTLASITPANGAATGGTAITLTGTGFQPGAAVSLGGAPAFAVNVASNGTSLTAITSAHPAGTVDVVFTNPDGQAATLAGGYTFNQAPALSSLTPDLGPISGGQVVTLSGSGFQQGATVLFGTTSGTVTNVTATRITVTSPGRPAGVVSVRVTNPDGQSSELTNAYRYLAPPALASLTPSTGPSSGGTLITLTGTSFTADAQVTFGGTPATQVTVMNATTLQAVTPAHAAGAVDVVVSSASGTSTLAAAFTYQSAAPTIVGVAPTSGSTEGGTAVTVTGTNFVPGTTVSIGGADAAATVVSSTLVRAVTSAHAAGTVSVTVTNPGGLSADLPASFTYVTPSSPTEGRVTDGGTGGVRDTSGGATDVIRPAGACGCNAGGVPALALLSLAALALFRRRRT